MAKSSKPSQKKKNSPQQNDLTESGQKTAASDGDVEQEATIFVRVKETIKNEIRKYGSDRQVVEAVLSSFLLLSEDERRAVVEGSRTLERVGDLLAQSSWSNHYFARSHWAAAAISYSQLARRVAGSKEHLGFALYRIAYALNEFGLSLRSAALEMYISNPSASNLEHWDDLFRECRSWLLRSIEFCKAAIPLVGFPASYNAACGYSILAQVTCEQEMCGAWAESLARESKETIAPMESIWVTEIGLLWREKVEGDRSERVRYFRSPFKPQDVNLLAEQALELLRFAEPDRSIASAHTGADFFRRFARRDLDLLFLNADKVYGEQFREWWAAAADDYTWLLQTSQKLTSEIPLPATLTSILSPNGIESGA